MKKEQFICKCGRKASKSCANRSCFNCCKITRDKSRSCETKTVKRSECDGNETENKCRYHDIYMRAKKKYSVGGKNIIMNKTTPSVDKIRKKRRWGKKITVKVERTDRDTTIESRVNEVTRKLESHIRETLGRSFEDYSVKISIKI